MPARRALLALASILLASAALAACGSGSSAPTTTTKHTSATSAALSDAGETPSQAFPKVAGAQVLSLEGAHSYTPHPPNGGTDDYHCTLLNPHLTQNSMIIASHFFPNSDEVHHAILFLVPPAEVPAAESIDDGGKGWTCFGETALPGQGLGSLGQTPWLAAWAPGHGLDQTPKGTAVDFPKGSMVIMQIHYNLLEGDAPVRARLMLQVVKQTPKLTPLHLDLLPAPPDIPCPAGEHGPLCNRAASLAELGKTFGESQVQFVNIIETVCGRNPSDPPAGDTTSCTWTIPWTGKLLRVTPHLHLLGKGMKVVLNPGTPQQKVLLNDTDYNFDYQRSFNITPTQVNAGDRVSVTCTYDPKLEELLPQWRNVTPHFVTWGDGSTDEMCLAILSYIDD